MKIILILLLLLGFGVHAVGTDIQILEKAKQVLKEKFTYPRSVKIKISNIRLIPKSPAIVCGFFYKGLQSGGSFSLNGLGYAPLVRKFDRPSSPY